VDSGHLVNEDPVVDSHEASEDTGAADEADSEGDAGSAMDAMLSGNRDPAVTMAEAGLTEVDAMLSGDGDLAITMAEAGLIEMDAGDGARTPEPIVQDDAGPLEGSMLGPRDAGEDGSGDSSTADACMSPSVAAAWENFRWIAESRGPAWVCANWTPTPCFLDACSSACPDAGAGSASCASCNSDDGAAWPNHEIPVCFTAATAARSDFAMVARYHRDLITAFWPSIADVEFTGWQVCTPGATGIVPLEASYDERAAIHFLGYQGEGATYAPVVVGTQRADSLYGFVEHMTSHVLGIGHHPLRPLETTTASDGCGLVDAAISPDAGFTIDTESAAYGDDACYTRDLDRWDVVAARKKYGSRSDNVVSTGLDVYARKRSTGDFYKLTRGEWTKAFGPVGQLVAVGTKLYALTPDLSQVLERTESGGWKQVGYEARELFACAGDLCAVLPRGDLARFRSGSWTLVGGPASKYVATATSLYRLTWARPTVEVYSDTDRAWYQVKTNTGTVYAADTTLLATSPFDATVSRYKGQEDGWEIISPPVRLVVGVGTEIYALDPDRINVQRYTGSSWGVIGGKVDWIYGAPDALYVVDAQTKEILRYRGGTWEHLGQP
jgi:hypothetical protein